MSEWQPIETAPRDGRPVWAKAFLADGRAISMWAYWAEGWCGEGWYEAGSSGNCLPDDLVWMPLLDPPVTP